MRTCVLVLALLGQAAAAQDKKPPDKKDAIPDGLKALQHPDPVVRMKAAMILGTLGKTSRFAVPELRDALKDKDVRVRVVAAEALWKIEKTAPAVLLPVLEAALRDKNPVARALAPPVI